MKHEINSPTESSCEIKGIKWHLGWSQLWILVFPRYSIFNIISKLPASLLLWGIDLFCEFTFPLVFLFLERKKDTPFSLASGFLLEIKINFLQFDLKQDLETMDYKEKLGKKILWKLWKIQLLIVDFTSCLERVIGNFSSASSSSSTGFVEVSGFSSSSCCCTYI